jgi:hypothetical protein
MLQDRLSQKDAIFLLNCVGKEILVQNSQLAGFYTVKSIEFCENGVRIRFLESELCYFVNYETLPYFNPKKRIDYVILGDTVPLEVGDVLDVVSPFVKYKDVVTRLTGTYAHTNNARKYKIVGKLSRGQVIVTKTRPIKNEVILPT